MESLIVNRDCYLRNCERLAASLSRYKEATNSIGIDAQIQFQSVGFLLLSAMDHYTGGTASLRAGITTDPIVQAKPLPPYETFVGGETGSSRHGTRLQARYQRLPGGWPRNRQQRGAVAGGG